MPVFTLSFLIRLASLAYISDIEWEVVAVGEEAVVRVFAWAPAGVLFTTRLYMSERVYIVSEVVPTLGVSVAAFTMYMVMSKRVIRRERERESLGKWGVIYREYYNSS